MTAIFDPKIFDTGVVEVPIPPIYVGGGGRLQRYSPNILLPVSIEQSFHGILTRRVNSIANLHGTELRQVQRDIELFGKLKQATSYEVKLSGTLTRQAMHEQALKAQLIRAVSSETQFKMTSVEPLSEKILRDLLFMESMD